MLEMLQSAIEDGAANVAFGILFFAILALLILAVFFAGLAIRAMWQWLTRGSWNRVIVKTERKATR